MAMLLLYLAIGVAFAAGAVHSMDRAYQRPQNVTEVVVLLAFVNLTALTWPFLAGQLFGREMNR